MIIPRNKSVIPACDVDRKKFGEIIELTSDIHEICAYKVGASLALLCGLPEIVRTVECGAGKLVIYDHQKAGTDIHEETPQQFMDAMANSGVDAVILFPQAGPVTEYEWIRAAQVRDLGVIVGGEMTHPRYLEGDLSNGKNKDYSEIFGELGLKYDPEGFIRRQAPETIYEIAARMGVTDFVVPGNKPERIQHYKSLIERCGVKEPVFYSPGLIAQGGSISESAKVAGDRWHAIVGRALYGASDIRKAAQELTSQLA